METDESLPLKTHFILVAAAYLPRFNFIPEKDWCYDKKIDWPVKCQTLLKRAKTFSNL